MNIRCFIAIPMPEPVLDTLSRLSAGLPGARWSDEHSTHLTLRFLGEIDGLVFRDVASALEEVALAPFELTLSGLGHFPPRGQPRVLWAGISASEDLKQLRRAVGRAVGEAGAEPERRKWLPHVTLARLNGTPTERLARYLSANALFRTQSFQADRFHLYSSQLHHSGAIHTIEETYRLGR